MKTKAPYKYTVQVKWDCPYCHVTNCSEIKTWSSESSAEIYHCFDSDDFLLELPECDNCGKQSDDIKI